MASRTACETGYIYSALARFELSSSLLPRCSMTDWQTRFSKRFRTIFKKGHELEHLCPENIRVYVLVERLDEEMLYHWSSEVRSRRWPPDLDDVVSVGLHRTVFSLTVLSKPLGRAKSMTPDNMKRDRENRKRRSRRPNRSNLAEEDVSDDSPSDDMSSPEGIEEAQPSAMGASAFWEDPDMLLADYEFLDGSGLVATEPFSFGGHLVEAADGAAQSSRIPVNQPTNPEGRVLREAMEALQTTVPIPSGPSYAGVSQAGQNGEYSTPLSSHHGQNMMSRNHVSSYDNLSGVGEIPRAEPRGRLSSSPSPRQRQAVHKRERSRRSPGRLKLLSFNIS